MGDSPPWRGAGVGNPRPADYESAVSGKIILYYQIFVIRWVHFGYSLFRIPNISNDFPAWIACLSELSFRSSPGHLFRMSGNRISE